MKKQKHDTSYKRQNNRLVGDCYEVIAEEYLRSNGYCILERNFRCKFGEVDMIAMHQETIVFIEVKYRATIDFGNPTDAVNKQKQIRISNVASFYMYSRKQYVNRNCRFDVVSIAGDKIELYQNAFSYCGRFLR